MNFKELNTKLGLLLCKNTLEEHDFKNLTAGMSLLFQLALQEKKFSVAAQKFGGIYLVLKDAMQYDFAMLAKQRQITLLCRAGNYNEATSNLKLLEVDCAEHSQLEACFGFKFLTKIIKPLVEALKENNFAAACGVFNNARKALGKGDALNTLSGFFVYVCDGYIDTFPNNRAIYEDEIRKQLADSSELVERLLGKAPSLDQKVMADRAQPTVSAAPAVTNNISAAMVGSGMGVDAKNSETKTVMSPHGLLQEDNENSLAAMDLQSAFAIVSQFVTHLKKIKWEELAVILDPNPMGINRLMVHLKLFNFYGKYSELDHLLALHYLLNDTQSLMQGAQQLLTFIQAKLNLSASSLQATVSGGLSATIAIGVNSVPLPNTSVVGAVSQMPPPAPRKPMQSKSIGATAAALAFMTQNSALPQFMRQQTMGGSGSGGAAAAAPQSAFANFVHQNSGNSLQRTQVSLAAAAAISRAKLPLPKTAIATNTPLPPQSPAQHGLAGGAAPPSLYLPATTLNKG